MLIPQEPQKTRIFNLGTRTKSPLSKPIATPREEMEARNKNGSPDRIKSRTAGRHKPGWWAFAY